MTSILFIIVILTVTAIIMIATMAIGHRPPENKNDQLLPSVNTCGPPQIQNTMMNVTVKEGQEATFKCMVRIYHGVDLDDGQFFSFHSPNVRLRSELTSEM